MQVAYSKRRHEWLKWLLENVDIDRDDCGETMMSAIKNNDEAVVRIILDSKKYDVTWARLRSMEWSWYTSNVVDTPLMTAAGNGNTAIIKLLVDAGVNMEIQHWYYKETALFYASHHGHVDAVNMLLDFGADVNHENFASQTVIDCVYDNLPLDDDKTSDSIVSMLKDAVRKKH
jgi:ankyrin repeat protein